MGVWAHYVLFFFKIKKYGKKNPRKLNCSYEKVPHALKNIDFV